MAAHQDTEIGERMIKISKEIREAIRHDKEYEKWYREIFLTAYFELMLLEMERKIKADRGQ